MNNEQRAHDLALLVTKYLIEHPYNADDNTFILNDDGEESLDIYKIYKENYHQLLASFNRDF